MIGWLHIAAEITAVDFRDFAIASKLAAFHFFSHARRFLKAELKRAEISYAELPGGSTQRGFRKPTRPLQAS
jgi:hypothetical protein